MEAEFALRLSLVLAAALIYYGWAIKAFGVATRPVGRRLLNRLRFVSGFTADEVESLVGLVAAAAGQAMFVACSLVVTDVSVAELVPAAADAQLLVLGALLGIGEAGLASFLGYVGLNAAYFRKRGVADPRIWTAMGRGGWVRLYLRTAEIAPWPLLLLLTAGYVTLEETFFRGVLITFLLPNGAVFAVSVSTALFVLVQVFHMPSWRAALFPAMGGLVVGIVHAVLFVHVRDLAPLIVAHLTMFLVYVR